jgi:uncharacterized membrane protein
MMNTSITKKLYILITLLVAVWCAGILAAPALAHAGFHGFADISYSIFSRVCHQNDAHSFHLEGEKFGVCVRCSAIYFGFLSGLLLLPFSGTRRWTRTPNPKFLIAVMVPMAVDVELNVSGIHFSTILTRVATGLLFGSVMPWYIIPLLGEACSQLSAKTKIHSPDS